jgi:hypothetical protein
MGLLALFCMYKDITSEEKEKDIYGLEIASHRYIKKVTFENHTYIYLRSTWSSAGDKLLHDPECECRTK